MLRLRRPSPAMGVALIALLVSLGGTSVAALSVLPPGSVGTEQLRNDSVTRAKVAHESITGVLVKDGSLLVTDFAPGQIPAGPPGPVGPQGPKGDSGSLGPVTVLTESVTVNGSATADDGEWQSASVTQMCKTGYRAVGAGTGWSAAASDDALSTVYMRPVLDSTSTPTGYHARGANDTGTPRTFTLYVLCTK